MRKFDHLLYEERNGVAYVTLNRPEVLNAFNPEMAAELGLLWRDLRSNGDVGVVVVTGAGDKAFCSGVDRRAVIRPDGEVTSRGTGTKPFHFDDPATQTGPKANDLWKPVIAAVNGMACGGIFYLLGEVEFIIASSSATFFDPHITFGTAPVFESIQLLHKMPFHELSRMMLTGSHERISAERAHQIGLVSEVTSPDELLARASVVAEWIAGAPRLAVEGTVRALWAARELSRAQATGIGPLISMLSSDRSQLSDGQAKFLGGNRVEWSLR
jgi:enoyl-CoA hydratase/carnithine racemase